MTLSLDDLKTKFKKHTVAAALQCTGNRRHELKEVRDVQVRSLRAPQLYMCECASWVSVDLLILATQRT